jgi:hypothetical protein
LQTLNLNGNTIGDAGAASIGGALAYVLLSDFGLTFINKIFLFGATRFLD